MGSEFTEMRKKNAEFWKEVMSDYSGYKSVFKKYEGMQEGRNSPAYNFHGGNFSPIMDNPTHEFHKWIATNLINKMKIILIMGLPGSGKTTLANEIAPSLNAKRLNADEVRKEANDWDFSEEGRKRQAKRMADFAKKLKDDGNYVIADFVCPTPEARSLFPADYIIWVNTIKEGRFDDTNKMFVKPEKFDLSGYNSRC